MISLIIDISVAEGEFADHHDDKEDDESTDDDADADDEVDSSNICQYII